MIDKQNTNNAKDNDLNSLFEKIPSKITNRINSLNKDNELLEIVLDIGRNPEARFINQSYIFDEEITEDDLQSVIEKIGSFGNDNRAGIERTLHRISAIRNRNEKIIGLTLRVGRAIYGTIRIVEDLIMSGKSILLLGKPGVGKTTMLRDVARLLANNADKRVIVVDTSNEIAGDGDIPHPGIGRARRMPVKSSIEQYSVMIEAVENHMPEVIVIDEIGTEMDANAARTIAERGVQLIATAHGNSLDNLIMNPTLSDLIGGIESVTLGDIEARKRKTRKTVLERRSPPTFDIVIEIENWNQVNVHENVSESVDDALQGKPITLQSRIITEQGEISQNTSVRTNYLDETSHKSTSNLISVKPELTPNLSIPKSENPDQNDITRILPYGVSKSLLNKIINTKSLPIVLTDDLDNSDLLLTTKAYYRKKTRRLTVAENNGKTIYVLRKNSIRQVEQFITSLMRNQARRAQPEKMAEAIREVENAISDLSLNGNTQYDLQPQNPYLRRIQHKIVEKHGMFSKSTGSFDNRHVVIYKPLDN